MTYKFKIGDTGLTRDGQAYRVIADDVRGAYPILALFNFDDGEQPRLRFIDGSCYRPDHPLPGDLMLPVQKMYLNIYGGNDGMLHWGEEHSTRDEADEDADFGRLSCIRVDFVRGRFDD